MHASHPQDSRSFPTAARLLARSWGALALVAALAIAACHVSDAADTADGGTQMKLTTSSFHNGLVPRDFTCDGADRSPRLHWTAPPEGTKSLALIVTDPDAPAGTWVHWVLYNLPATARELPEDLPKRAHLPDGSLQGQNDFGSIGYGGPCPPRGSTHRYVFELYALDALLSLQPGATRAQLEKAMQGHVLALGELMGRYGR